MYRFAPSPTRDLHIEDLRNALFNYICAKQNDKKFLVRIEDINKIKNIDGKDQEILDILAICGMKYDYLYYQSENFKYHLQFASSLMDKGLAFACFCTTEEDPYSGKCINISQQELLNNNLPFTIRIKKPKDSMQIKDTLQGDVTFKSDEVDSFVIMTQEKYPTYNFACACDDMLQGISHVIRGKEHLCDAARQELVRSSLGFNDKINYTHLPSIVSDEDISVKSLIDQGFLPEAIINYLISITNKTPKEIFTLDEAIEWFSLEDISNESVKFDIEKLKLINREHIKLLDEMELSKIIGYSSKDIGKLAKLYTKEANTTFEIKEIVDDIFAKKSSETYKDELEKLKAIVKDAPYFEKFDDFKTHLIKESDLEGENFLNPLSILITNKQTLLT